MRIALFLANIQNCSNYMQYVIVRYDQISVDAHAHAARYNGNEQSSGTRF